MTDLCAARAALHQDGAALLTSAIAPRWLDHLREAVDHALSRPSPLGRRFASEGGAFYSDLYLSASFPAFDAFARQGPAGHLMGELIGAQQINLFTDELLVKEPGTTLPTPWHHDGPYWPVKGWHLYSMWIPLDPVEADNGGLTFIAGSHRWDRRFHPVDFDTRAARVTDPAEEALPALDRPEALKGHTVRTWDLAPGDALVFHALTLHAAGTTRPGGPRRRAVVLRLAGPDVRYAPRPRTLPLIWAPALAPGDPLDGELFPTLWSRP